jgi:hypothetical protein
MCSVQATVWMQNWLPWPETFILLTSSSSLMIVSASILCSGEPVRSSTVRGSEAWPEAWPFSVCRRW